jgi:hypothetical protein
MRAAAAYAHTRRMAPHSASDAGSCPGSSPDPGHGSHRRSGAGPAPDSGPAGERFRDSCRRVDLFLDSVLVRCPNCSQAARVLPEPPFRPSADGDAARAGTAESPSPRIWTPRRLVCTRCGLARTQTGGGVYMWRGGGQPAIDPYFHTLLWLQTETRHGWLWAYNEKHLDLLERYVRAKLRERSHSYERKTLVACLPRWIKQAGHRDEVLRAVDRIRASTSSA